MARQALKRSIGLGLIATELIINALKHAFPEGRAGAINLDWASQGSTWSMSVTDNGVGMTRPSSGRTGLGGSIVAALAKQLDAAIEVSPAAPETGVAITHPGVTPVGPMRTTTPGEAFLAALAHPRGGGPPPPRPPRQWLADDPVQEARGADDQVRGYYPAATWSGLLANGWRRPASRTALSRGTGDASRSA